MAKKLTQSEVYRVLANIPHPEIPSQDLVGLGMIPVVEVQGKFVTVTLELPFMNIPIKQDLIDSIREAVSGLQEELEIEVVTREMSPEQRAAFMTTARQEKTFEKSGGKIAKVLAVMSGKGGVGKSSVTGLLAVALHRKGWQVGVLDADITGPSIPKMFGVFDLPVGGVGGIQPVKSHTGIKIMSINLLLPDKSQPVVWRGPLISRAIQQFWSDITWGDLDFLLVDLPPGTSDAALTVTQSLPLDGVVLVTSPQDLAGMVVQKAANMAKQLGVPLLGLVENMSHLVCPHCGQKIAIFGVSRAQETALKIGVPILGHIPLDTTLSPLCDNGALEDYQSEIIAQITTKVLTRMSIRFGPVHEKVTLS
jgi:Mrp family chromosome partitioning ATPase